MKTNQEMVRYIDSFSVVQRTSDGYFDGTELLRQWNNVEGNPRRQMSKFLESDNTSEFLKALAEDESHRAKMLIGENQLLIKVKGRKAKAHTHTFQSRSSRKRRLTVFHTCCAALVLSAKKPPVEPSLDS